MIAEINTAYSPDLVVLDGVDAFVEGEPDKGTRAQANVILAGSDRVAIDAVGVKSPEQIQLVADDPESEALAKQVRSILLEGRNRKY